MADRVLSFIISVEAGLVTFPTNVVMSPRIIESNLRFLLLLFINPIFTWPTSSGQLYDGNHVDTLGGSGGSEALCPERPDHVLLGVDSDILGDVEPPVLVLRPQGLVIGVQEVLQLDSGLLPAHSAVATMVENFRQSPRERTD